jgi:hypothetical protein
VVWPAAAKLKISKSNRNRGSIHVSSITNESFI